MNKYSKSFGLLVLILLIGLPLLGMAGTKTTSEPPDAVQSGVALTTAPVLQKATCILPSQFIGTVGVYGKNLKTNQVVSCNADHVFAAASTIKVPVSVIVYNHFYGDATESQRNLYDTGVDLMMRISDNDYFAEFLDEIEAKIEPEAIRQQLTQIGLANTTLRDERSRQFYGYSNTTTAKDMALFFELLYTGKLLPPDKTQFINEALSHTIFPDELARYMQDRRVLHKIGELDNVLADVGIVEGPSGPILISVFTETDRDSEYASEQIAAMSACVYSRLTGEKTAWESCPPIAQSRNSTLGSVGEFY